MTRYTPRHAKPRAVGGPVPDALIVADAVARQWLPDPTARAFAMADAADAWSNDPDRTTRRGDTPNGRNLR